MSIIEKGTYKWIDEPSLDPVSSGTITYNIPFISNNKEFSYMKTWNGQCLLYEPSVGSEVEACSYNGSKYTWNEAYKTIKLKYDLKPKDPWFIGNDFESFYNWFKENTVKIQDTKRTLKVNGKVLSKVNNKYLKNLNDNPIFAAKKAEVVSASETWLINENPDITVETFSNTTITGKLNPLTANNTYGEPVKMYMIGVQQNQSFFAAINAQGYGGIIYGLPLDSSDTSGNKTWKFITENMEIYTVEDTTKLRTITFDTAPTGELLTWLQANAVKQ